MFGQQLIVFSPVNPSSGRWIHGIPWILLLISGVVEADTVALKSGGFIKNCRILEKDPEMIFLRTPGGRMGIPREKIKGIERNKTIFDTYEEKRAKVRNGDWAALFQLAEWCRKEAGLREETYELLERVIALNKNHAVARRLLGYTRIGNRWKLPPPLLIRIHPNDSKDLEKDIREQLSILLMTRRDLQLSGGAPGTNRPEAFYLAYSVVIEDRPASTFFGHVTQGPTTRSTVKFGAAAKWIGRTPWVITLQGTTPANIKNSRNQALIDAIVSNSKKIHDLFDMVVQKRLKELEAADQGSPEGSREQKTAK